jgi:hypothetical protein
MHSIQKGHNLGMQGWSISSPCLWLKAGPWFEVLSCYLKQGRLTKGKNSLVHLTSMYKQYFSVALCHCNIFHFFSKTSTPNEEVNSTEPSLLVGLPCPTFVNGFFFFLRYRC